MISTTSAFYDELVEKCKQGDLRSCKELYQRYADAMYNVSLRIVNHTADAEDVLQEAFLAAFTNIRDFDHSSAFGAWLKRIVINKSISLLRKKKFVLADIENVPASADAENVQEEEEFVQWKVESIKKAMKLLPNGYRTILSLALFEECSYEEISGLLNISNATARSQYHRGRQKLLELIKKEAHDERQTTQIHP